MLPSNHFSIDVTGAYNVHNTTQLYNRGSSLPNLQDMHYFQFKLQDNTEKGETWLPLFHPTLTYDLHCWLEFIVSASTSWVLRQHSRRSLMTSKGHTTTRFQSLWMYLYTGVHFFPPLSLTPRTRSNFTIIWLFGIAFPDSYSWMICGFSLMSCNQTMKVISNKTSLQFNAKPIKMMVENPRYKL